MAKQKNTPVSGPVAGKVTQITPDIRRIIAPNPSPMTFWGTNTYLLGQSDIAVIDPGPNNRAHMQAILGALAPNQRISHILVTHAHLDHSPLAKPLAQETGAKVLAYGDAFSGRSKVMRDLVAQGLTSGGEGVDHDFAPDICLTDGQVVSAEGWSITAIWTPGHMANHMCFDAQGHVFSGDHVMGWASSLVSPPDGDLAAFMTSCERLAALKTTTYLPGHGAQVTDPAARIAWLIQHRKSREAEILAALKVSSSTISALTKQIYTDVPVALVPAAERNVFAHLIDLVTRMKVIAHPQLNSAAEFSLK